VRGMADEATWAGRVAEWRASGLTSPEFCRGKDFTAGGLRHWAHTHGLTGPQPEVRLARVVRVSSLRSRPVTPVVVPDLLVEVGGARIVVRPGFDRATLGGVLDVVMARSGR